MTFNHLQLFSLKKRIWCVNRIQCRGYRNSPTSVWCSDSDTTKGISSQFATDVKIGGGTASKCTTNTMRRRWMLCDVCIFVSRRQKSKVSTFSVPLVTRLHRENSSFRAGQHRKSESENLTFLSHELSFVMNVTICSHHHHIRWALTSPGTARVYKKSYKILFLLIAFICLVALVLLSFRSPSFSSPHWYGMKVNRGYYLELVEHWTKRKMRKRKLLK